VNLWLETGGKQYKEASEPELGVDKNTDLISKPA
jgi:hypothetical protein